MIVVILILLKLECQAFIELHMLNNNFKKKHKIRASVDEFLECNSIERF